MKQTTFALNGVLSPTAFTRPTVPESLRGFPCLLSASSRSSTIKKSQHPTPSEQKARMMVILNEALAIIEDDLSACE